MITSLLLAVFIPLATNVNSQTIFSITEGSITSCSGAIVDSGGEGGPGYSNNEYYVATICPDSPDVGISLSFIIGNLSTAGVPTDELVIYDGNSTAAPVLGTYTGTTLSGAVAFASYANPTGCLTLEFTSNSIGTGSFAATITCFIPCLPPTAVASMSEAAPVRICPGESINFDGSASSSAGGFNIVSYEWDFADGTTATGATVDHAFMETGDYLVQLTLEDDNGCNNTNLVDLQVLVGTEPNFVGTTAGPTVCEGGTVQLNGVVNTVTWTGIPEVDLGGGVALPDNVGETFSSSIENTYLQPGATLTNINDIQSICVDMEHSFMGDLVINITCPNGQSVILHQQGGGGTFLGEPIDIDTQPDDQGTCWNYCWNASSPNGTWVDASANGMTTPSMGGNALTPGTYVPVGNMNSLLGCPLNGTWTLNITDLWGSDNGFLCNWEMNFDPSLYPDLVQFTPTIGNTTDSIAWSGPGVVVDPSNPLQATATPTEPGDQDYTLTVTDNFGCTYDTTITVIVTNAPQVGATVTLGATCSDQALLEAEIIAFPPASSTCNYTIVLHDTNGDGWTGNASITVVHDTETDDFPMPGGSTLTATFSVTTGDAMTLLYTAGSFNQDNSFEVFDNSGALVYSSPQGPGTGTLWTGTANCGPGTGPLVYTWTPAGSTTPATGQTTTAAVTVPTEVVVTVFPQDAPYCSTTDTVLVIPPSFLDNDSMVVDANCFGEEGSITILTSGPGGPWNYSWQNDLGSVIQTTQASVGDALEAPIGTFTVIVTEGPTGNGCSDTLIATIAEPPLLEWQSVPSDTTICVTGDAALNATAIGGTAPVNLVWNNGLSGNGTQTVSPLAGSVLNVVVQAVDANGCTTDSAITAITVLDYLTFDALVPDTECYGIPVPYEMMNPSGGDGNYTYNWWGIGIGTDPTAVFLNDSTGNICVSLNDGCETPPVSNCAELVILHSPDLVLTADTTLGCAPLSVRFDILDTTEMAHVSWDFGNGFGPLDSTSVTNLYTVGSVYDVGVNVLWPNGCYTDSVYVDMIEILTVPVAHFDWSPHPPTILDPVVEFYDASIPNVVAWDWDFGEFGTSTQQDTIIEFPEDIGGDYPVQLVVYNALGCSDTVRVLVRVEDEFIVYVPNAFTPNGADGNEIFRVEGNDLSPEEFSLIIFDRWGEQIFNTNDITQGWDGTLGGKGGAILPQGVYVYKLEVHALSSTNKRKVYGHVTLLR
ncbi:MAG: gliding motility-associated C-terminal domain-containing protein [Flavobacteriales bacterium]|nr:gliding motility-associated C-terminal domain-containing protein [Flavobacteriales bacterium]MBK9536096.1 gliding motility-associated C-terminal domain-containing protein [Flavobacteriales bacterium]MBP9139292.1 gliding motility-associated C-terminal domain-containing protein [Flavobacteriales bacterium]HQV52674.1 PKD domain-containing protein [Flavobacteriales bacterium]HQX30358.1 PKD domain-containing protein [Flavobacteriales bacterium]